MIHWDNLLLEQYLERIAKRDLAERREGLLNSLKGIGTPYDVHQQVVGEHNLVNISVPMHLNQMPYVLVVANYDNVENSEGANNNAAAVAISLAILRVFHFIRGRKQQALPLEFAFLDGHHQHMLGSQVYAETVNPDAVKLVINMDLCGIGDIVLLTAGKHLAGSSANSALQKLRAIEHLNLHLLDIMPPSNELAFEQRNIPTITTCIAPEEDVMPILGVAISMQNEENIALLPNVYECIQFPERDTLDTIDIHAMRQMMLVINTLISNMLNVMQADWK